MFIWGISRMFIYCCYSRPGRDKRTESFRVEGIDHFDYTKSVNQHHLHQTQQTTAISIATDRCTMNTLLTTLKILV